MLRTGSANGVWFGPATGAVVITVIITFFGLFGSNRTAVQDEANSTVSEQSPPSGASKPALVAPSTDRTTSLATRADENTSTKQ
jgi:hypothetical protein